MLLCGGSGSSSIDRGGGGTFSTTTRADGPWRRINIAGRSRWRSSVAASRTDDKCRLYTDFNTRKHRWAVNPLRKKPRTPITWLQRWVMMYKIAAYVHVNIFALRRPSYPNTAARLLSYLFSLYWFVCSYFLIHRAYWKIKNLTNNAFFSIIVNGNLVFTHIGSGFGIWEGLPLEVNTI